jgi:hypothetical protein
MNMLNYKYKSLPFLHSDQSSSSTPGEIKVAISNLYYTPRPAQRSSRAGPPCPGVARFAMADKGVKVIIRIRAY